jgi:hypothetical protein
VLWETFWFVRDYVPVVREMERDLPTLDHVRDALGDSTVEALLVPHDCTDGFFGAYWRRPTHPRPRRACLDLRAGPPRRGYGAPGGRAARRGPSLGEWDRRCGDLGALEEIDLGYRLVVARRT